MTTSNQKENIIQTVKKISDNCFEIYKEVGETPLVALEKFRETRPEFKDLPMTYAGRLDPMAEGVLLILVGEECKNKQKYLGLDKEYEVEIVLGINTDSYDALGLVIMSEVSHERLVDKIINYGDLCTDNFESDKQIIEPSKYVGKFKQPYPPYSSKTVNGIQLHQLVRNNKLPEEMPEKEVEIYSFEVMSRDSIGIRELGTRIFNMIDRVRGDFRQEEIKARWQEVQSTYNKGGLGGSNFQSVKFNSNYSQTFEILKIKVQCSSGTYMRSLAYNIGKNLGVGAFALGIKRTRFM